MSVRGVARLFFSCTALVALTVMVAPAANAEPTQPVFQVMNTSETLPDGVYFRYSPHWNDTSQTYGLGVFMQESVQLQCYAWGDPVGAYNNTLWYYVINVSRPTNFDGQANRGMLNAHFVNDGSAANVVDAGVPACVNNLPPPPTPPSVTPCVYDMRWSSTTLTWDYSGRHRYLGNAYQAARNWTDLGTAITVTRAIGAANITFVDYYSSTDGRYAHAVVPTKWTGPAPPYATPFTSIPPSPHHPSAISIMVNQYWMEQLDDFHRTYALTHELGHALGLGHSDACVPGPSIMKAGGTDVPTRTYNKPKFYDRIALEELYGLPLQ